MYCVFQPISYHVADLFNSPSSIPIGRPLPGYECWLLDSRGRLVPPGQTGELFIGGVGVMAGYWKRPELTAAVLREHPLVPGCPVLYKTGDLCHWRGDGQLMFEGRADFQVKIRGQRLELGEVEAVLRGVSGVSGALALKRSGVRGDYLAAFVVADAASAAVQVSLENIDMLKFTIRL